MIEVLIRFTDLITKVGVTVSKIVLHVFLRFG